MCTGEVIEVLVGEPPDTRPAHDVLHERLVGGHELQAVQLLRRGVVQPMF